MSNICRILKMSWISRAAFHTCCCHRDKNLNRQVKIMTKLLGERKSGSKKRWYPSAQGILSTDITKVKKQGKSNSRRVAVLNKLFMRHITDLLATGEASEEIIGKGLEISKVNIHSDFHGINVYWLAKGTEEDDEIEVILKKCSGTLRHELSQLRLIGEVPKITFVKDKLYANIAEVENILKKCGLEQDITDSQNSIPYDFGGYIEDSRRNDLEEDSLPLMRHDVFGLDRNKIMERILSKMKKSKQAWEKHETNLTACTLTEDNTETKLSSTLENLQQTLEETTRKEEEYQKLLKQRRLPKKISSRKEDGLTYADYEDIKYEDDLHHWRDRDEGDFLDDEKYK